MSEEEKENMTPQEQFEDFVEFLEEQNNKNDNIFDILGASNWEIRHSKFLAWLLNPNASHGLDSYFLKRVLSKTHNINFDKGDDVSVKTELSIDEISTQEENDENANGNKEKNKKKGKRRIDIFVEGKNFTITIENKYGTGEHDGQLKAYKEWVNDKSKQEKDQKNFFIYLDLYKPKDFDDEHYEEPKEKNPYYEYKFLSYEIIKEILSADTINEKLNNNKKEQSKIISIIKDYTNVIENEYNLYKNNKFIDKIKKINDLDSFFDYVEKLNYNNLSEKEKNAKNTLFNYKRNIQKMNDEKILPILKEIIDGSGYYAGQHSKAHQYANVIRNNNSKKLFAILNQIDYPAFSGLKICMYSGILKDDSKSLINYIDENFWEKLENLDSGWQYDFNVVIRPGGKQKGTIANLKFIINDIFKNYIIVKKQDIISNFGTKGVHPQENNESEINQYIVNLKNEKICFENESECKKRIEEYQKRGNECYVNWGLYLKYDTGINFIDESNKDKIKKIYINKTLEGLEILGHDEDFYKILSDEAKKLVDNKEKYKNI